MIDAMLSAVTNLFRKPHTYDYPAQPIEHPEQYRGLIDFSNEHCIFCDQCEKVCPPKAIVFMQNLDGSKTYNYNPYLCIYCGECVRACPKRGSALWQSEIKAVPASRLEDVNNAWFEWQEAARQSREEFAEARRRAKQAT